MKGPKATHQNWSWTHTPGQRYETLAASNNKVFMKITLSIWWLIRCLCKPKERAFIFFQVANIIFVDEPVGTGFSYAKSSEGYNISDTLAAAELYEFLLKVIKNYIITWFNLVHGNYSDDTNI